MKLTENILQRLGFRGEGKDITNKPAYRLKVPSYYHYELQIVLGNYPETNGNSGVVSLYDAGVKDAHCLTWEKSDGKKTSKKIDHIMWEADGQRGGLKYITLPARCIPIAWHVTTVERLNAIYTALTLNPPLKLRPEINKKTKHK